MTMKTKIILAAAAAVLLAGGAGLYQAHRSGLLRLKPREIVGELKVLSHSPRGDEIPISTDGLTVLFNKAVVPLTTLDSGRDRAVPLKITPDVDGEFFWLGTHGFIFRPEAPLDPATRYRVEMPAGIVSVDGYRLNEPLSWEFSTVAPRTLDWEPRDNATLLPQSANIFLRFNLAMNASDVEKKLSVTDAATGQILLAKRKHVWSDDGHALMVQFQDDLPWESSFQVTLPQGVRAKKGTIGTAEPVVVTYATPTRKMEVVKVYTYDLEGNETVFQPGKEAAVRPEGGTCFAFSQPIDKKSFEKAFHAELAGDTAPGRKTKPPIPYYYFLEFEAFPALDEKGGIRDIEGYRTGCAAFFDDYDTAYRFSIDPKKIVSLSGAPLETGGETYLARTGRASPELRSVATKSVLSHKGPMRLPYRGINLKSATVRLYRLADKEAFDEDVKNETFLAVDEGSNPPTASLTGGGRASFPVDPATRTIDQARMPADATLEVPLSMKPDESTPFSVDLTEKRPAPGLYLVETVGNPLDGAARADKEGRPHPGAVYAMFQVTPVGLALKRESERVLIWATDIESGAPLASLPLKLAFKKWDSSQAANHIVGEGDVITNAAGVALLNLPSTADVQICAEVTQPGSESYTCENDHKLTGYRRLLKPAPHYFAYLYTDRPIYRPGQTVHFSSFVRQVREGRYFQVKDQTPATLVLTDASGQELHKNDQVLIGRDGIVHGTYDLEDAEDLPRGQYSLSLAVDGQTFAKAFTVASYRKPSFKVDLKPEAAEIVSGESLKVQVQGSYFFGAPMRKSRAAWSIMTSTYRFAPEGFDGYSFVDEDLLLKKDGEGGYEYATDYEYDVVFDSGWPMTEDESQHDNPVAGSGGGSPSGFFSDPEKNKQMKRLPAALDEAGVLKIAYRPDLKKYPTSQVLTVEASLQDPSRQEVSGSEDVIVHKGAYYLGVRPEKWSYGAKEAVTLDVVSLDTQGRPAGSKSFKVDVIRRDYKFIERRTSGGYWDFEYVPEDTPLATLSGKTGGDGRGRVSYTLPQGGTFRLVARGSDSKGNLIQSATTVYAWGEGYVPWRLDEPESIELVPDKDAYRVGETAKILVKSLVPVTKALATLERGRLLEYKVIDLGGNASHIEVPITEGMIPNLYLSVVAHVGRAADHPPLLYHGETEIAVEPEKKRLSVAIATAADGGQPQAGEDDGIPVYRPGDSVTVRLETKDADGKPRKAHVMVSVADESVLRLLNYKLPDLVKKFYYRRPNSVATSSSLFSLKAGDSGPGAAKKRRVFKDTAHFEAHLVTDAQGRAEFSFKLPDDLTTWVIEALAITDSKTAEAFEAERQQAIGVRPVGQTSLGSDLALSDDTFVGGERTRIMTTLPVVLRAALPRFAVWGDAFRGGILLNNRNPRPVEGKVSVSVSGDGVLEGGRSADEIEFSVPANGETSLPIRLSVESAGAGRLTLSATARDDAGRDLDALEVSLPVKDRYAPETTATAGMTDEAEKEQVDLPPDTVSDKGGLSVSLKASVSLAAAPSLRSLIHYPYGCSEQKSASLLALLMARGLSEKFGETYFDALAPFDPELIKKTKGWEAKLKLLDDGINEVVSDLTSKFLHANGGVKYWPESRDADYFASVQVLWALTRAKSQGFVVDETARDAIKGYVRSLLAAQPSGRSPGLSADDKAYGLWALTLDRTGEFNLTEDLLKEAASFHTAGLAYALMALKNSSSTESPEPLKGRLLSLAKHEPRHTSWPADASAWSTPARNTALAAWALLTVDPQDPNVFRALTHLLNRKKTRDWPITQEALYQSALMEDYARIASEDQTSFQATVALGPKALVEKSFDHANLLSVQDAEVPMKDLKDAAMPADLTFSKTGAGRLYYDMVLKYYLPPAKTPTREEGLIVSREFYDLDDVKEEEPLTEFEVGENYKGHITLVIPQEMNYILVQDLLPSGFEPVDMTLATTSQSLRIQTEEIDEGNWGERGFSPQFYDDVVSTVDYGTDWGFAHQEIRDDSIVWSDEAIPAGVYHIRYPIRATTAGTFLMPGALAFEFYEPEIFGRSRGRVIQIKE